MKHPKLIYKTTLKDAEATHRFKVEFSLHQAATGLGLSYLITGNCNDIVDLDQPTHQDFKDELWQTTCFELFYTQQSRSYIEWNVSSGGQWACYEFASYRKKLNDLRSIVPKVSLNKNSEWVLVEIELPGIDLLPNSRINPCVIVRLSSGKLFYFSIDHPPQGPDFHNFDCFQALV